ncbi:MAG: VOC family protein [Acidobacteriota bacterium]|nr:VOC family protein [Acidobacteriota bacterium]
MKKTRVCFAVLLVSTVMVMGCATRQAGPAVQTDEALTPTHGKFVWYDLLTEDVDGVKAFYGELLGWTYEDTSNSDYFLVKHRGRPIGGIVDMTEVDPDSNQSQWVSMLSVADVVQAVQMTERAGGETHLEPVEIQDLGTIAVVSDPQGALVSFLRTEDG